MKNSPLLLLLSLVLVITITSLPAQFDKRTIGANSLYTNYKTPVDGICLGQTWAQQIAQTMSNMESVAQSNRIELSSQ